ncbi:MAG: nucleotidyl transferase AbiEii/AbiGii toxin family protein [bacterium]
MKELFEIGLKIQNLFKDFYLAGGTAIMFKHNHRRSMDLDFFKSNPFSFRLLSQKLRKFFLIENEEFFTDNIDFYIKGIRVSFVFFPYKNINKTENFKGLKIASDYDIFLNKIYTAGRRIAYKDLYDCAFLYKIYRWEKNKIKRDFEKKFPNQSFEIYLGALLSFEDYGEVEDWLKETLNNLSE